MGLFRMVEKGSQYADSIAFPAFYMNDFSVLGLVVKGRHAAQSVLLEQGFTVREEGETCLVRFHDHQQMEEILQALEGKEISYTFSDLVSCAYQG